MVVSLCSSPGPGAWWWMLALWKIEKLSQARVRAHQLQSRDWSPVDGSATGVQRAWTSIFRSLDEFHFGASPIFKFPTFN